MAIKDLFSSQNSGLTSPAANAFAITPHATNTLPYVTRGIYVGGQGDVVVEMAGGGALVTFSAVPAGTILPIRARRVTTASDATNMVGIY